MLHRPATTEHAEYYGKYIDLVPDGDVLQILRRGIDRTAELLGPDPEAVADRRYAPGKWTVREVLAHLTDSERVFGFRAFWFARSAEGEMPSMDQDTFAAAARAGNRSIKSLFDEWRLVRDGNLAVFDSLDDAQSQRVGIASGKPISVRSLIWIAAGHEIHHRNQLKEKYLRT